MKRNNLFFFVSLFILILFVASLVPSLGVCSSFEDGQALFFEGKYNESAVQFEDARKEDPGNDTVTYFLGKAYYNAGDYRRAKVLFAEMLQDNPGRLQARAYLARCCFHLNEMKSAKKLFAYLAKVSPRTLTDKDRGMMARLDGPAAEPLPAADGVGAQVRPVDRTPPAIVITSPLPARGIHVEASEAFDVRGVASDDSRIKWVKVNGNVVGVNQEGVFTIRLPFNGETATVLVQASDIHGNTGEHTFLVRRGSFTLKTGAKEEDQDGAPGNYKRYAVVIGIGEYADPKIPPLKFATNDALGFYEILANDQNGKMDKDDILILINNDATTQNIKKAIGTWLKRKAKRNDMVFVYFAGHGAPEDNKTYWITYDSDIEDLYSTALSNDEISDMLARIDSRVVVTFLDSCYSAATINRSWNTRNVLKGDPFELLKGKGRVTITSSDGKQESLELKKFNHGLFTYYLMEGMRGSADANKDGCVFLEEIWGYIKDRVTNVAHSYGMRQTPILDGKFSSGIFISFSSPEEAEAQK